MKHKKTLFGLGKVKVKALKPKSTDNIMIARIKKEHLESIWKQLDEMPEVIPRDDVVRMIFAEYEGCIDGFQKYAKDNSCVFIMPEVIYNEEKR